jgi:hypothetical protein
MKIIIDNVDYVGRNMWLDTTVQELEDCLIIANKKTSDSYQHIDKEADMLKLITNIPEPILEEIPVQKLHELFLTLTTQIDKKDLVITNEWNGYVTKGFDDYKGIMANRKQFRNFEKHLKKKTRRYISHIIATFFTLPDESYEYHYEKKLEEIKQMPSSIAIPYVFRAMEIILETTKQKVDAEREEVQAPTEV